MVRGCMYLGEFLKQQCWAGIQRGTMLNVLSWMHEGAALGRFSAVGIQQRHHAERTFADARGSAEHAGVFGAQACCRCRED